jgi:hypothetical protein
VPDVTAVPTLYYTVLNTRYYTVYMIVSNYWERLADGSLTLKGSYTQLLTPEEYAELKKEQSARAGKPGSAQAPRPEGVSIPA